MVTFLFLHGIEIFIFFLFPLIGGLILDHLLHAKQKNIRIALIISLILLMPLAFGYEYIIPFMPQVLGVISLSSMYYFLSIKITRPYVKIITSCLLTAVLFFILGFAAAMDSFGGYTKTKVVRSGKGYQIKYVYSQGFAGRPYIGYELHEYFIIPVLTKHLESVDYNDTVCDHRFELYKVNYDRCNGTITKL